MHKLITTTNLLCVTLLLAACGSGGNDEAKPESSGALLADGANSTLVSNIVTGADSTDNQTRWVCELSNDNETSDNYILSFWADKTGVAGVQSMSWFAVNATDLSISWDGNQILLSNFLFNEADSTPVFSATSDKNDRLDCELSGPKPLPGIVQSDFIELADARIVNDRSDQSDMWECTTTDLSGARTIRTYAFWNDGMGTGDSGNFSWFFNEDDNIIVSYETNVRELRSIRFADDSAVSNNFTALERQYTLNCSR